MPIRNPLRLALFCALTGLLLLPTTRAAAQIELTDLDPLTRAQFAAVPLTADELPDGYVLLGETFLSADQYAPGGDSGITGQTLVDSGFQAMYTSVYGHESGDGRITSYASLWNSGEDAVAGFELLEDESVTAPEGEFTDSLLDVDEGPAELSSGTIAIDGTSQQLRDASFVIETLIVGVTSQGSADAVVDTDGMTSLAQALEARAATVTGGAVPDGTDFSLATQTLNISTLGTEVQVGFLSPREAETIYGLSGSSLGNLEDAWVSLVSLGDDGAAPYLVVGRSSFEDAETAARVVEQSDQLVPLTISLEPAADFTVEGAGQVRGFTYVSPTAPDAAAPNSFRAVAQVDSVVIIVDVQGAGSVEDARAAATALLTAQLDCTRESCELPDIELGS